VHLDLGHFLEQVFGRYIWLLKRIYGHANCWASIGVSLVTQILYIAVFTTRYLDLFWVPPQWSWWNFILKNFYIWSSIFILILMTRIYARTREIERAWKLGGYCAGGSVVAAPIITLIFKHWSRFTAVEVRWSLPISMKGLGA
jgi:ER lumen protein retaining receptor